MLNSMHSACGALRSVLGGAYRISRRFHAVHALSRAQGHLAENHIFVGRRCLTDSLIKSRSEIETAHKTDGGANSKSSEDLIGAAMTGDAEGIRDLLAAGVDVNANLAGEDWTPLIHAAAAGQDPCVELLIAAGADVNRKDGEGWTPLMHAAMGGHSQCLEILLKAGAIVDSTSSIGGTALMNAAADGHIDCLQLLLAAGADSQVCDQDGLTAFDYAEEDGNLKVVSFLLRKKSSDNKLKGKSKDKSIRFR